MTIPDLASSGNRLRGNRSALLVIGLTVMIGLSGCSSPQVRYHTLMPLSSPASGRDNVPIAVTDVTVPPQVNRRELVVRQNASHLIVLESDWWGAFLADEIQSVLDTYLVQSEPGPDTIRAAVAITRFDSVPGEYALIEARVQLTRHDGERLHHITCRVWARQAAAFNLDALVRAHQQNLITLAQAMRTAADGSSSGDWKCP
ncbi:PqiC family protein [Marinobacter caseinilyticus]|uniref:PqiC family protein n=1 Tax=Marinobacter caseinilyticus TaxID=2692195 RepID=UPI0014090B01|nr:PqiC family protein [Marinobacter caseinilyticus]